MTGFQLCFILRFITQRYLGRIMDIQWQGEVLPNVISETGDGRKLLHYFHKNSLEKRASVASPHMSLGIASYILKIYIQISKLLPRDELFMFQTVCLSIKKMKNF